MIRKLARLVEALLIAAGIAAIGIMALCFTPTPWHIYHWLGRDAFALDRSPDYIVIMGGGGIPSESGLMRTYEGAVAARLFPHAKIIVALPSDSNTRYDDAYRMRHELVIRGIRATRVAQDLKGRNTREQALNVTKMIDPGSNTVLLVTSPEHVKRALKSFRKLGCTNVAGRPAYQASIASDLLYQSDSLGGSGMPIPDVGEQLMLRYTFWNNVRYLSDSARELCALGYYWLKGWV
jgi:uncharacterized SAM-binding protein YcdF (DUF218 family)